jgi:hypothetical protein
MTIWPTKDRVYVDGIDCPCRIQYGGGGKRLRHGIREDNDSPPASTRSSAPNPTLDIEDFSAA